MVVRISMEEVVEAEVEKIEFYKKKSEISGYLDMYIPEGLISNCSGQPVRKRSGSFIHLTTVALPDVLHLCISRLGHTTTCRRELQQKT